MEHKKRHEPGGYVTTSRNSLIGALVLMLASGGVVWFFVAKYAPPVPEEEEDAPVAGRIAPPPRKRNPAPKPTVKPLKKPEAKPKPKPKPKPQPVVATKAFQDGIAPDPGYRGTIDTYLLESDPRKTRGKEGVCIVDGDEPGGSGRDATALFRWDLTSIPRDSVVREAKVTFHVADVSTHSYKVYRVREAWTESRASWRYARDGRKWKKQGGTREGDVLARVLGNKQAVTVALDAGVVQDWVRNPDRNYGIVLAPDGSQTNGLDLHSRETSDAKRRPRLEVTYAVTPGP